MKKKKKKDRGWIWDLFDLVELIGHIILYIPRVIFQLIKEM